MQYLLAAGLCITGSLSKVGVGFSLCFLDILRQKYTNATIAQITQIPIAKLMPIAPPMPKVTEIRIVYVYKLLSSRILLFLFNKCTRSKTEVLGLYSTLLCYCDEARRKLIRIFLSITRFFFVGRCTLWAGSIGHTGLFYGQTCCSANALHLGK